jgi:hypothetical protein
MKTYVQLDFENNTLIVSNGFLKVEYMDWSLDWIVKKLKFSP